MLFGVEIVDENFDASVKRISIKKNINIITIIMLLLVACFTFCLINCVIGYSSSMGRYADVLSASSDYSVDFDNFSSAFSEYISSGEKEQLNAARSNYNTAQQSFTALRFGQYANATKSVKEMIESIRKHMKAIEEFIFLTDMEDLSLVSARGYISEVTACSRDINTMMAYEADYANELYEDKHFFISVCEVIGIVAFAAFILLAVYLMYFNTFKISKSIYEIADWAGLFEESYAEMAPLDVETNVEEIYHLSHSFNIVRNKLIEANTKMDEYHDAVSKLKEEEENKKKFVQQLYVEKRERETYENVSKKDGLTGLYNRRTFDEIVDEFMKERPRKSDGALMLIDMDNFKNVNDTLGHLAGDEALKTLAGAMRVVLAGAYLGRYGGDEFIAFFGEYKSTEEVEALAHALNEKMDRDFDAEGKSVHLSVSIGVAYTDGIEEYSDIYMQADKALYYAKEHGRNQFKTIPPLARN